MLSRYKMYRGKRPASDPMPQGIRQDSRWRTHHPLRPTQEIVERYLAATTDKAWESYVQQYMAILEKRFAEDRKPFDDLANLAMQHDVFIGCSCPTKANPNPAHCHTTLALRFMKSKYPSLRIGSIRQ